MIEQIDTKTLKDAIKKGNYDVLVTYKNNGYIPDKWILNLASEHGNLEALKYLHQILLEKNTNPPWDSTTCEKASSNGYLECLKYLYNNGCPLDKWSSRMASSNGHLECLKYLLEIAPETVLNVGNCQWSAENGHLDCLKYLHENGCPWDIYTIRYSYIKKRYKCVSYAYKNGCPCDKKILDKIIGLY